MSMPNPKLFSFRLHEHLRRPEDFQRVYDQRRSVADDWLIVYGRPNDLPYLRLGLSVSRKVGPAVQRNRLRRLYREAFRLIKAELPSGLDLVLIPRTNAEPPLAELQQSLAQLVRKLAQRLGPEKR
jgi:ribonuclease P protein component